MNARAYQKYVHVNEKRMMDNLKEQFIEEWSIVCALEEKDARKELNDALEMSCADLQPKKPIF